MKNHVKVALNMSQLPVPEKINKATFIVQSITANLAAFPTPVPSLTDVSLAIDQLEQAYILAADGGKSKTAQMHDKEAALMDLMLQLAHFVQTTAAGNEETIHLAGMDVKRPAVQHVAEFRALPSANSGEVNLKIKARPGTQYKWQYRPDASTQWTDSVRTKISKVTLSGLAAGVYWFRVIFQDGANEYESTAIKVAVA